MKITGLLNFISRVVRGTPVLLIRAILRKFLSVSRFYARLDAQRPQIPVSENQGFLGCASAELPLAPALPFGVPGGPFAAFLLGPFPNPFLGLTCEAECRGLGLGKCVL